MGLIRKSLCIGTVGTVKSSSRKQRVADETLIAVRSAAYAARRQPSLDECRRSAYGKRNAS